MLLTGKRMKNTSSLAAFFVHGGRPPPFSSDQVRYFVERRTSLGADLVEALTCSWLVVRNSISILWLSMIVFCVIGLDVVRRKLTSLFERVNGLDGGVGGGVDSHDEDMVSINCIDRK
jgi:hypothetical protein